MQASAAGEHRVRLPIFLCVLWLSLGNASWASTTETKAVKAAKASGKNGSIRDLLFADALDSKQWYFWNFEGTEAKKTVSSSFRSNRQAVNIETTRLGPHL